MTILSALKDGKEHRFKDLITFCCDSFNLTEEERKETLSCGQAIISNRVGWAKTYLKKAGLIESPSKGVFQITTAGQQALDAKVDVDLRYLMKFESFKSFFRQENTNSKKALAENPIQENSSLSPQEQIENAIKTMNNTLADELMEEVMKISCYDFEKLIVKLLIAMGYGSMLNNQSFVTAKSHDEGIDGILTADTFGFDSIYIQAKQWKRDSVVGRPEIQKFGGAMMGQGANKGVFITTTSFSKDAQEYAKKNLASKIVLVDGVSLAKLMIQFDIGVSTVETYRIKKVDTDFFADLE